MSIVNMLIKRIQKRESREVTVREINSGHNKGDTGIYLGKDRVYCAKNRSGLIRRLNLLGSLS